MAQKMTHPQKQTPNEPKKAVPTFMKTVTALHTALLVLVLELELK